MLLSTPAVFRKGASMTTGSSDTANTGFPSSRKSARAAERQLADRVLEVQDYGGTQEVAIQQGDTTTVIQQDPTSSRPKVEVHDKQGVHTASKYKPLDTPGISITKGGAHNKNTVVEVGEGDTKQSIELLKKPTSAAGNDTAAGAAADKLSLATGAAAAAAAASTEGKTQSTKPAGSGSTAAKGSKASTSGKKKKSSFHGGGTTLDSAASSNNTERASQDQKQAMAATDRQKSSSSGEVSSSSSSEAHPKDPARRQADTGLSGPLSSVGMAAAAVASGVKSFVSNSSEGGCTDDTIAALPQLKLEQLWKPTRSGFDTDVTLVTQLSLESLSMLQNQCELWSGPIAAVAYMPLLKGKLVSMDDAALNGTTVEEQKAKLAKFYETVTHAGPCRMTLELVSEEVPSGDLSALFPFNALRNHALLLVKTEVVLLLDVDFLPAEELSRIFSARQEYQSTLVYLYNNAVIVLPAFETLQGAAEGQSLALKLAKGDKDSMMEAIVDRKVRQYQVSEYEKGQRASDYPTWLSSSSHYTVKFEEGYEPYIISARKNVPWYDERFRGHGRDRIVQTLNMAGFVSFAVHPTAYVVQQPHPLTASTHFAKGTPKYQELMQTYSQIRGSILGGEYEPVSAFSCQQGHTSYTAADLPTKGQVSEAAWAASQASAGRLAALTSQDEGDAPLGALDPAQQLQQAQRESAEQQQARTKSAAGATSGNVTAISSKAVAAKAAAKSAAENLQGDADESAAVTQSQMPVDVAAQLQQAQQLAQQQAADFKQNNEGSTARLDASSSTTASAGSTLGLSTGSSSAADPTALSVDESTMDPAEKLQLAQQHQAQQAATFKQKNEGTSARLDTASNAAAASAAAAAATTSQLESASTEVSSSSNDTGTNYSGIVVGGLPEITDKQASEKASANMADATKSLGESVVADGNDASKGAVTASGGATTEGASEQTPGLTSTGSTAANKHAVTDNTAAGGSQGNDALVAQSQEAGQQQALSIEQDSFADTQTLPNSVSVTR